MKPSPALVDHLITDHAFMLTASSRSSWCEQAEAPEWFSKTITDGTQVLANPSGTFFIFWYKGANLLHATDSGSGFRLGATEPARPITTTQPEGRLPNTPPPKP